ncbi:MAG TPA: DNA-3-methyladenine glycosylase [Puia sp.]|nr:DNA-3-methyladenine glycosylase [Puia sp.]
MVNRQKGRAARPAGRAAKKGADKGGQEKVVSKAKRDQGGQLNGASQRKLHRDAAAGQTTPSTPPTPRSPLVRLDSAFYDRASVVAVARDLLGKVLVTEFGGQRTSGRIVEVEAYNGVVDRASHAWSGRRTRRTEVMYLPGGIAYVYLIYGIHHLFNVVTNRRDVPHAVLVRALDPMEGIPVMLERMKKPQLDGTLTRGPGNLSRAMGLMTVHTGTSLLGDEVWIGDDGFRVRRADIGVSPRIGVDYAGEDAALLYRFYVRGNRYVSGGKGMR